MAPPTPASPLHSLLAEHLDLVYSAALRQTRDPHLAEDITQTVFLIAAKKHNAIPPDHAAAWLIKVTRYTTLNALRAQRRRHLHEQRPAHANRSAKEARPMTAPPQTPDTPPDAPPDPSLDSHLDAALIALSESDRQLLLLRYFQNQPIPAIAAALHLTDNTASKRLERALQKLRRHLVRRGITTSAAALPATLLSSTIRPAPKSLAPQILSNATISIAIPLGVLLMTATTKLKLALVVVLLILALIPVSYTAYHFIRRSLNAMAVLPLSTPSTNNATLAGTVRDDAGNPIPRATVTQGWSPFAADRSRSYHLTTTDDSGHFSLPGIPAGTDLLLAVTAPGRSPEFRQGIVAAGHSDFAFTLHPGHVIRFRFVDAGNPVPYATAEPVSWRNHDILRPFDHSHRSPELRANADGLLVWDSAPADAVEFFFDGHYRSDPATVAPAEKPYTIVLRDPLRITLSVVDARTNAPIPEFTYTLGQGTPQRPEWWSVPKTCFDGTAEFTDTARRDIVRVEADHYPPMIQSLPQQLSEATLTLRLSKTAGIGITLLAPDGKPANDVPIQLITSPDSFRCGSDIADATSNASVVGRTFTTDDQGTCRLLNLPDPHTTPARLLAFTYRGFLSVPTAGIKDGAVMKLLPWAHIDGVSKHGLQPASNDKIQLSTQSLPPDIQPGVYFTFTAITGPDGRFDFPTVPPEEANVYRTLEIYPNATDSRFHQTESGWFQPHSLALKPGQFLSLTVGGTGRPVTGRIINSADPNPHWLAALGHITDLLPPPAFTDEERAALDKTPADQQEQWREAFNKTDRAKAYLQSVHTFYLQHPRTNGYFPFIMNPDGAFPPQNVSLGEHTLQIIILDSTGAKVGYIRQNFTIPPVPAAQSDAPLNLGDLPLQKQP